MNSPMYLSSVTSNYLQSSTLGQKAQSAGAEDKDINDIIDEKTSLTDKARFMDANISAIQAIKLNFEAGVVGIQTGVQFKFKDSNGEIDMDDPERRNLCTRAVNFASFTAQKIINGI